MAFARLAHCHRNNPFLNRINPRSHLPNSFRFVYPPVPAPQYIAHTRQLTHLIRPPSAKRCFTAALPPSKPFLSLAHANNVFMTTRLAARTSMRNIASSSTSTLNQGAYGASKVSSRLVGRIFATLQRNPFFSQMAIAVSKTVTADYIAQKYFDGNEKYDARRGMAFALFALLYQSGLQYFFHVFCFSRMFPTIRTWSTLSFKEKIFSQPHGWWSVVGQNIIDQCGITWIYYPLFYALKGITQSDRGSIKPAELYTAVKNKLRSNFIDDVTTSWVVWMPANMLVFALPLWLRLPVLHSISFGWICLLSILRGKEKSGGDSISEVNKTDKCMKCTCK